MSGGYDRLCDLCMVIPLMNGEECPGCGYLPWWRRKLLLWLQDEHIGLISQPRRSALNRAVTGSIEAVIRLLWTRRP